MTEVAAAGTERDPDRVVRAEPPGRPGADRDATAIGGEARAILDLQRSAGNRGVTRLLQGGSPVRRPPPRSKPDDRTAVTGHGEPVVSRAPTFVPTFGGAAGVIHLENLNADVKLNVPVKNAKSAPSGTTMVWSWGTATPEGVERGDISPATGTTATFNAKAKKPTPAKAKDELAANLEVTPPGGTAVVHPVSPPMRVGVLEPEYAIKKVVKPGPKGGGTADALRPGDVLEFHISFDHVDKPKALGDAGYLRYTLAQQGLHLTELQDIKIGDDQPFQTRPHRWDGDTLVYSVYCHHAGTGTYTMDFNVPGAKQVSEKAELKAEATLEFFLERCNAASDRHRSLVANVDAYLQQGFLNYKHGYEAAEAAFKEYANRVQLTKDILLGILFAGIGGAAGGAAGGLVKFNAEQKWFADIVKTATGQAKIGAVTDAVKDVVKYTTRLTTKLGKGGNPGAPKSDDATPDPSGAPSSKGVPGSIDPLDWYGTVQKAKSVEESRMATVLQLWKTSVINAIAQGSTETIDWDPVNAITEVTSLEGKPAATLGEPPSAEAYEKNMWEAWIEHYAYTLQQKVGCGQWGYRTEDNVGKELRDEMERVEKALVAKGIDAGWVQEALDAAKAKTDAKAKKSQGFGP